MNATSRLNTARTALSTAETTRSQWTDSICLVLRADSFMNMRNHKRIMPDIREGQL